MASSTNTAPTVAIFATVHPPSVVAESATTVRFRVIRKFRTAHPVCAKFAHTDEKETKEDVRDD